MTDGVDMRARRIIALWAVTLSLLAALACGASFEGPETTPPACPVPCGDGMCCPYNTSCTKDGMCRTEDVWPYGARRDAGVGR